MDTSSRPRSYKAFVSSTYEDLKEHRAHVISSLRRAGISVDPMEDWTAATDEPKAFSGERIRGCDLCVLLVAFRRGYVPRGETLSITQLEYGAALAAGVDVLVFLLNDDAPWRRPFDELGSDPGISQWRRELRQRHGVELFGLAPESVDVVPAITRWITERQAKSSPQDAAAPTPTRDLGPAPRSRRPSPALIASIAVAILVTGSLGYFGDLWAKTSVLPHLTFVWETGTGWIIRNDGRGTAFDVTVAHQPYGASDWQAPTRFPSLQVGEVKAICWLRDADKLIAVYADVQQRKYTSVTDEDRTALSKGDGLASWTEADVRRNWERPCL